MAEAQNGAETTAEENSAISQPAAPDQETPSSANAEAAKYRKKLREAESKLEAAEARITAMLRKEIEAYAAKSLAVGADLFTLGEVEVKDLLTPDGEIDTETIDAAVEALLKTRPGLGNPNRPWGAVVGGRYDDESDYRQPTMQDALRHAFKR